MTEDEVAKWYRDYGYVVFRRCLLYLGDPALAHDALRAVFVRVLRRTTDLGTEPDPRAWLCRIADEHCIDRLGRRGNAEQPEASSEQSQLALESAIGDDDREALLTVRRLLQGLELDSLRLAVLYHVDELTQEELARELGLSPRAVGKRLQQLIEHARAVLRQEPAS
jgi:RNA polymerase sigma factor (sigma-70 family)